MMVIHFHSRNRVPVLILILILTYIEQEFTSAPYLLTASFILSFNSAYETVLPSTSLDNPSLSVALGVGVFVAVTVAIVALLSILFVKRRRTGFSIT